MVIDHIGIVVRSLEQALHQWEVLSGYRKNSAIVLNTRQKVRVVFRTKPGSMTVKLIERCGPDSPAAGMAKTGGGLHDLCFRCDDLGAQVNLLKANGAVLMVAPQPGEAFKNHDIAFWMTKNNLNIELIHTSEREGWITNEENPPSPA